MWLSRSLSNIARPCRINRAITQSVNLSIHPSINRLSVNSYHDNNSYQKPRRKQGSRFDRRAESSNRVNKNDQLDDADEDLGEIVYDSDGNKIKKQKYALYIGYSGHGYRGLQKQIVDQSSIQSSKQIAETSENSDSAHPSSEQSINQSSTSSSTNKTAPDFEQLRQLLDNKQPSNPVPSNEFIEGCLEDALYGAGYIRKENYGDLTRSSLSRSSRTDKGVSAAVAICSLKLLIPEPKKTQAPELKQRQVPESKQRQVPKFQNKNKQSKDYSSGLSKHQSTDYSFVLEEVNKRLPADIRLLFVRKMPRRWHARQRVTGRTYRYVVPVSLLSPSFDLHSYTALVQAIHTNKQTFKQFNDEAFDPSEQTAKDSQMLVDFIQNSSGSHKTEIDMDRLNQICQMFEGNHSMHNYTRLAAIKRKSVHFVRHRVVEDDDVPAEVESETVESDDQSFADANPSLNQTIDPSVEQLNNQPIAQTDDESIRRASRRMLSSLLHRKVHSMSATQEIINGVECVTFSIYGESFVYHQIRKMMAMVIAVYHDLASPFLLEASLICPREIPVGLAPSLPLMLDFTPAAVLICKYDMTSEVEYPGHVIESINQFRTNVLMPKILDNQLTTEGLKTWAWFYYWLIVQLHFQVQKNPEVMKQLAVEFEEAKIAKAESNERKAQKKIWQNSQKTLNTGRK